MDDRTRPAVERVVDAVVTETERDALELPPLAAAIDPDALNALAASETRAVVSFPYAGQHVTVDADGAVSVEPRSDSVGSVAEATSDD